MHLFNQRILKVQLWSGGLPIFLIIKGNFIAENDEDHSTNSQLYYMEMLIGQEATN